MVADAERDDDILMSGSVGEVIHCLRSMFEPEDLSEALAMRRSARWSGAPALHPNFERPEPAREALRPWTINLTKGFAKSAEKLDKKMQGRVLTALIELCRSPDTPHGDTIKPLEGERSGDWRYRIGDYRVIYRPDHGRREVLLLEVASRGGIYA